jgi:hypothetical protein
VNLEQDQDKWERLSWDTRYTPYSSSVVSHRLNRYADPGQLDDHIVPNVADLLRYRQGVVVLAPGQADLSGKGVGVFQVPKSLTAKDSRPDASATKVFFAPTMKVVVTHASN